MVRLTVKGLKRLAKTMLRILILPMTPLNKELLFFICLLVVISPMGADHLRNFVSKFAFLQLRTAFANIYKSIQVSLIHQE